MFPWLVFVSSRRDSYLFTIYGHVRASISSVGKFYPAVLRSLEFDLLLGQLARQDFDVK